jgi:molybdopterin molybdotransferase
MPEFLHLLSPKEALERLIPYLALQSQTELVELSNALGRVTAAAILAPHALPPFARSTVDGYAVVAADTYGASDTIPAYLKIIGEVPMGAASSFPLRKTTCASIHTGGMLPTGADAVVMLENTQTVSSQEVEILRAAAVGENTLLVGEDVMIGQEVMSKGALLRPAEIGGLAALGITQVKVRCKPRVAILSTGDEIIPLGTSLKPGKVFDVNTYTLSALVDRAGGEPMPMGILPDKAESLALSAAQALQTCDMVVITAGSSASTRDLTAQVIDGLGKPGVLVHGVNVRPGKPTILAACALPGQTPKPVIGLPGNPVSAYVIASLFVVPAIQLLLGISQAIPKPSLQARLTLNVPSEAGREDWVPVRLIQNASEWEAEPVFGKSNLIFTLVRADGLLCIPPDATGLNVGEIVEVYLIE